MKTLDLDLSKLEKKRNAINKQIDKVRKGTIKLIQSNPEFLELQDRYFDLDCYVEAEFAKKLVFEICIDIDNDGKAYINGVTDISKYVSDVDVRKHPLVKKAMVLYEKRFADFMKQVNKLANKLQVTNRHLLGLMRGTIHE